MKLEKEFSEFGEIVAELQRLAKKLMQVIDKQSESIIAGNKKYIEHYTEEYTNLRGTFKEQEKKFVHYLQVMLNSADVGFNDVRLENLKEIFPESSEKINTWEEALLLQMQKLKQKHHKLNELIEFAVNRNVELMQSIYSMHNPKNIHYSPGGSKTEISSGLAVNKEA